MSTRLHIARVVLHGIDLGAAQRQHFQAELERQLGLLLAQRPLPPQALSLERRVAAPVPLPRRDGAEDGARAVAASLHGCLRP